MKRTMINQLSVLGFVAVFAILFTACQKDSKESVTNVTEKSGQESNVVVAFVKGDVVVIRESGQVKPNLGDVLTSKDTIVTGQNGSVEILVGEDGVLKLNKNTSLSVSQAFAANDGSRETEVNMQYGKLVTVLRKERKTESFSVVTPTSIAGVRGTIFLTNVENPSAKGGNVACGSGNCVVKYTVLDGAVAIRKSNSENEIVVDKQKTAEVGNETKLSDKMIKPMDKQSLSEMKEMLAFENTKMLQFESLANELKNNNEELQKLNIGSSAEELEKAARTREITKSKSDEVIKTAKAIEDSKYIKKDVQKDSLKLAPKESFDKTK
ncbi:FecR domain-containing protein [Leptospira sp. 2 VSF19]|uniref:FecR domain-containing protein n=1 Tax=Leptospira soteropolitanensis TaxID=2950025 RepID=A0AAW5VPC5_9LEPT|nr:FecR domain-containing protein [Leptospira soteropolitanensis]MCW7494591.1 FecR domain-containing protein [Leptospira soteropolitanensis]MCW7502185.1 FecR domain-containing protein [Leptospira soteropolitanensis]MCW7524385.1 FecR domain-containing protein [Leptospira soteropolitanensis]MCW7528251.1 FecR domain-containing protein [Leptospira soteropolitanensis]MCW7532156.1 FecR domain-containing protein [Leptospira soteropolitanensis]